MNHSLCFLWMLCLFQGTLIGENDLCERWDSTEGLLRLQRSEEKENFWKLARFYESQTRLTYCGVAAAVVALNALSIQAPQSQFLEKYRLFTQEEFFSENVSAVISQNEVLEKGLTLDLLRNYICLLKLPFLASLSLNFSSICLHMNSKFSNKSAQKISIFSSKANYARGLLDDLEAILKTFPIEVVKYEAQFLSHKEMRSLIISALKSSEKCVLVLYQRGAVKQEGTGH